MFFCSVVVNFLFLQVALCHTFSRGSYEEALASSGSLLLEKVVWLKPSMWQRRKQQRRGLSLRRWCCLNVDETSLSDLRLISWCFVLRSNQSYVKLWLPNLTMGYFHANSLEYNWRGLVSKVHEGVYLWTLRWKMSCPEASFMSDLAAYSIWLRWS